MRTSPLSQELLGLILPYDHYGTHLNYAGSTVDQDLELQNVKYAGETLAEVWSKINIDFYAVIAEFFNAMDYVEVSINESAEWYDLHVRES